MVEVEKSGVFFAALLRRIQKYELSPSTTTVDKYYSNTFP
jgi:hypothetical protein